MTIQVITPLPTPVPSRLDPVNFATRADAFLASLPTFGDELNDFASEANALALEVQNNKELNDQTYLDMQALENTMVDIYNNSSATSNFKGLWSSLTGSLTKPASVYHNDYYWVLLNNLVDVTTSTPSTSNTDWLQVIYDSSFVAYTPSSRTLNATDVQGALDQSFNYTNSIRVDNLLLNDRFAINQEALSGSTSVIAGAVNKYVADQWYVRSTGANINATAYTVGEPKLSLSATGGNATSVILGQRIETIRTDQSYTSTSTYSATPELNLYIKGSFGTSRTITWTIKQPSSIPDDFSTTSLLASGSFTTPSVTSVKHEFYIPITSTNSYFQRGIEIEFSFGALNSGNEIQIQAVQLVPVPRDSGIIRVEYKPRDITIDLTLCQRYYLTLGYGAIGSIFQAGVSVGGGYQITYTLPVKMRTTPTCTIDAFTVNNCTVGYNSGSNDTFVLGVSPVAQGRWAFLNNVPNTGIRFNARLN